MAQRLLVVDDDPITGSLLAGCGRVADVETKAVSDCDSFKRLLDSFNPTVVAIDIVMPDEDGISLLRHLASRRHRPSVILISAYAHSYLPTARRLGEAYGLTIVANLPKPINPTTFEAVLRRAGAITG